MNELYSKSHFLLVPSSSENHPGVINEAQLSGLVVIATDVGGISEMVTDSFSGFLAKNSPSDFQNAIRRALSSNSLELILLNALAAAELRTNEEIILNKHDKVIASLLNA
jgi:glycosyltransferase involved in cell wall biosynthesis